jgi:DNA-binding IclR family transcriptional regulator
MAISVLMATASRGQPSSLPLAAAGKAAGLWHQQERITPSTVEPVTAGGKFSLLRREGIFEVTDGDDKAQVVQRVATILRAVAMEGSDGIRLIDLARMTDIARPSVHRILQDLIAVGYVEQHSDKLYAIGPALFTLGLAAPNPVLDPELLRARARELAAATGDTVYVGIRSVAGIHYLVREEGRFPVRTQFIFVGDVKPFTTTYSGIVLLAYLPEAERERALHQLRLDVPLDSIAADPDSHRSLLRQKIREVRTDGYLYGPHLVVPGVSGVAAPIPSRTSVPYMSLSISAIDVRLPDERIPDLSRLLLDTAARMTEAII